MSGATTPVTTQSMTGNLNIDGLLYGAKWDASSITYSNPDSSSDYQVGYTWDQDGDSINVLSDGFGQINAAQLTAFQSALDSARFGGFAPGGGVFAVEGFTGLSISAAAAGSGAGTIRAANATDSGTAYGFFPAGLAQSGDLFLNNTYASLGSPQVGNYGWHTMLHEVGHTLGLKHGHSGTYTLPSNVDSIEFSVMTYRTYIGGPTMSGYSYSADDAPQTYMQLDILALQTMYGANYTINNTATTYTWNPSDGTTYINGSVALDPSGNTIFCTIWDGGGADLYDLSNYSTNLSIDLAPGAFSTFDTAQLADLGPVDARGNVANALLFNGDTRSLIENAYGGSGNDTISGNDADNTLEGNNGADLLFGLSGDDFLSGAAGNDTLDGGSGVDILAGGAGDDILYVDNFYDVVSEGSGQGNDIVYCSTSYEFLDSGGYIELACVTGSANANLTGNSWAQALVGNFGSNRLNGGGGNDSLEGAAGADTFVFSTALSGSNIDTIQDLSIAQADVIELARSVFSTLNAGTSLDASAFVIGASVLDANDRIVYNSGSGALLYDSDGTGASSAVQFATLATGLALSASNFAIA